MNPALAYSVFHDVLFPKAGSERAEPEALQLRRLRRFRPTATLPLETTPIVVFDFESTGLDVTQDRIIEIGAEKIVGFEVVAEFSELISTDVEISQHIQNLTGISPEMLVGKPRIEDVLPRFLEFIDGALIVAHNADFDFGLLRAAAARIGYDLDWPCFCTVKMARDLMPELENRKLDTLAKHFGLTFGSRHRSMGDVRVTTEVLRHLVTEVGDDLTTWQDLAPWTST